VVIHILYKDDKKSAETITIPRTAVPQRFLNPSTDPSFFRKKITIKNSNSDIAGFYTDKGIYKDIDSDGFSDRLVSRIIYDGTLPDRVINLAARLGLEDCAVSLPFTIPADDLDMKAIKNLERPILIGSHNRFIDYLGKIGKAKTPQLKQDEGVIQFCAGFNPGGAYIISGSTSKGENAALQFAAAALPFISARLTQPGAPLWQDLNREIELFFTRKNNAGQAAWGILQIDKQKKAFSAPDLEHAETQLYTMRHIKKLDNFISQRIRSYQKFLRGGPGECAKRKAQGAKRRAQGAERKAQGAERKAQGTERTHDSRCAQNAMRHTPSPWPPEAKVKTGGRLEPAKGFSDKYTPQWEVEEAREIFYPKDSPPITNHCQKTADKRHHLPYPVHRSPLKRTERGAGSTDFMAKGHGGKRRVPGRSGENSGDYRIQTGVSLDKRQCDSPLKSRWPGYR
jgi:hypothetical protein